MVDEVGIGVTGVRFGDEVFGFGSATAVPRLRGKVVITVP